MSEAENIVKEVEKAKRRGTQMNVSSPSEKSPGVAKGESREFETTLGGNENKPVTFTIIDN